MIGNRLTLLVAACFCGSVAAQNLNERYPVSAEVRELEQQVMQLAPDATARQRFADLKEAWLRERAAQCGGAANERERRSTELCAIGIDEDRIQSLRRTKFLILIETPSKPAPAELSQVHVAAALDSGGAAYAMGVTPNGARALLVASQKLLIIDTFTGQTLRTTPIPRLENAVLSFFPSGRVAAVTSRPVRGIRFFDTETGELLREFPDADGPHQVMPDGRRIAYADEDKLLLYDVTANRAISGPASHNKEHIVRIAVSPDGSQIATLTSQGTITLWRVLTPDGGRNVALSRVASAATKIDQWGGVGAAFSAGGDAIWTASGSALEKWIVSANSLVVAEKVEVGKIQGRTMRRVPGSDVLIVSGFEEKRGSYLLFYNTSKKTVAFVEVARNYYPSVEMSADGQLLFSGVVHELRRLDFPAAAAYSDAESALAALRPAPPPVSPLLSGPILKSLPESFLTEVIGVYEGGGQQTQGVQTSSGLRTARFVAVGVGRTDRPLVLALASYEPVVWDLNLAKGARLVHVLVSGAYESVVRGAKNATVTRIGSAYSYAFGDQSSAKLLDLIRQYTGKGVDGYQGSYRGIRFSVGTSAPDERADAKPALGVGDSVVDDPRTPQHQTISRWEPSRPPMEVRKFSEELYVLSAYTTEEVSVRMLVEAEVELVASRWLAHRLVASRGRVPAGAPARWDGMVFDLVKALDPVVATHLSQRARALKAADLQGSAPFMREYERLVQTAAVRPEIQFSDGTSAGTGGDQRSDMPEILAFHRTPAAVKWRKLWPEIRAHAAKLAALHYRVDADPALPGDRRERNKRAQALLEGTGGRVLRPGEWEAAQSGRLAFTLSGLDRFVLPLGTEMGGDGTAGESIKIGEGGAGITMTQREGRGLVFRFFDAHWEQDIARRLSPSELAQIDEALTASYVEAKGRWYAPLELEWDAYLAVNRQLRSARQLQDVYQSFRERSDKAMAAVWTRWQKG